jgi:hypothetical protein
MKKIKQFEPLEIEKKYYSVAPSMAIIKNMSDGRLMVELDLIKRRSKKELINYLYAAIKVIKEIEQ